MKFLVCVAGLPFSEQTAEFGVLVATLYNGSVTLLTVVTAVSDVPEAKEMLARLARQMPVAVDDQIVRVGGTAVSEIVSECQQGDYDMVILGTRLVHGFSLFKLSGVARSITQKVPIPTLVVKQAPPRLRRILICTSGQEREPTVMQTGLQLATLAQATVRLLYVADPMPHMYAGLETMEETVQELLESGTPIAEQLRQEVNMLEKASVEGQLIKRHGLVVDEILKEIEESSYDLVIIGVTEHEAFWQALVLGRVSPYVVENSSCSVLVVHHQP
ncbi:MAG: universal stress protein [Ardenticatenaceae bacterium]|nr:universal stress protein [Ardenticatenaceae bacterium]